MSVSPSEAESNTNSPTESVSTAVTDNGANAASPPANTEGVKAESPAADSKDVKTETLADRILNAVNKKTEATSGSEGKTEGKNAEKSESSTDGLAVAEAPDFTKEEYAQLPQKTARRVRYLNEALTKERATITQMREEQQGLEEEVGAYRDLKDYLTANKVSRDDSLEALETAALVVNDPEKALEKLLPLVKALQEKVGAVLPPDIAAKVKEGYLTEDAAQELSRLRASERNRSAKELQDAEDRKAAATQAANTNRRTVVSSVADWEASVSKSDPDYPKLQTEIEDAINGELARRKRANKLPKNNIEAVQLAKDCYDKVKKRYARPEPLEEMRHVNGRSAAATSKPRPASLAEAIQQAVNG